MRAPDSLLRPSLSLTALSLAALLAAACGGDPADPTDPADDTTDPADDTTDPADDTTDPGADTADPGADTTSPDACTPNACGGCAILEGAPGDPCGPCGRDLLGCGADGESLVCSGATPCCASDDDCADTEHCDDGTCAPGLCSEAERNVCGGCAVLAGELGDPCGPCQKDHLACAADGDSLVCDGETPCDAPTVTTALPTDVSQYAATLVGDLVALGDHPVTAHGFCLAESGVPALDDGVSVCSDLGPAGSPGPFSEDLVDLPLGTDFVVRAYATNEAGAAYGEALAWRTADALLPEVATLDATASETPGEVLVSGRVDVVGIPANTGHGVCLGADPAPALGDGLANCIDAGPAAATGPFQVTFQGLELGATYYVRAFIAVDAGAIYGEARPVTLRPAAPVITEISDGTDPTKVTLAWDAVPGATAYRVFRDGTLLTAAPLAETRFEDTTASAGSAANAEQIAPSGTVDDPDKVTLRWSVPTVSPGTPHAYTVRALNAAGESEPSAAREGARAGYAATGYEVTINGGDPIYLTTTVYEDRSAPAGGLSQANASASQGTDTTAVHLGLTGGEAEQGALVNYRVRVRSQAGLSAPSVVFTGARGPSPVAVVWQRSAGTTNDNFSDLPGATTRTWADTTAPTNEVVRFYRARVTAGATTITTAGVSGFRGANLPTFDSLAAVPVTQTTAVLNGRVASLGSATSLSPHGYCWSTGPRPEWAAGSTNCVNLGARGTTGALSAHTVTGLTAGTRYYFRAFAVFSRAGSPFTAYSADQSFLTVPPAPTGLTASTNDPKAVRLTWTAAASATEYVIRRGGMDLATVPATSLSYQDTTAPSPARPTAVPSLTIASSSCTAATINWTRPADPGPGADATYTVVARNPSGSSAPSSAATGRRAAAPVLGYKVYNASSGSTLTFATPTHATASLLDLPEATVTAGTATASDGAEVHPTYVRLGNTGATKGTTPTAAVRVTPYSSLGDGTFKEINVGRATDCPLQFVWQVASPVTVGELTLPGPFLDIPGATTTSYSYSNAPASGAKRYFRTVVYLTSREAAVTTAPDVGSRYAAPPETELPSFTQAEPFKAVVNASMKVTAVGVPSIGMDFGVCLTNVATIAAENIRPGTVGVVCKAASASAVAGLTYTFSFSGSADGVVLDRVHRARGYARNAWTQSQIAGGYGLTTTLSITPR